MLISANQGVIDAIIRTKNSQELLKECLEAVLTEIPLRRIIIVDAGSTDRTKEIALSYDMVEFYSCPDMNLGQATKYRSLYGTNRMGRHNRFRCYLTKRMV